MNPWPLEKHWRKLELKGSVAQHSISVSACIVATGLRKGLTVTMTTNPTAQGQAQSVHIHQSSRLTAWLTTPRYRSRPAGFSNVLIAKIFSTGVCHKKQKFLGTKKPWICPTFNGLAQSVHQNQKLKNSKTLQQVLTYLYFLVGTKIAQIFFSDAFRVVLWSFFDFCWWKFWVTHGQETSPVFLENNLVQKFDHGSR